MTEEEIRKAIKGLKSSTATGVDWIDSNCLKEVAEVVAPALAHITNLSINTKIFPSTYKVSKIIPLKKSSELSDLNTTALSTWATRCAKLSSTATASTTPGSLATN